MLAAIGVSKMPKHYKKISYNLDDSANQPMSLKF